MSREVKFRAWDNQGKYVTGAEFGLARMSIKPDEEDGHIFSFSTLFPGRYTWEQFTGLFDIIGRGIYEGDIVRGRWWRAKNARLDTKGEIIFEGGWFYIKDDPDGQDRIGVPIHNCYNLEVIGNVNENEELLDGC